MNCLEAHPLLSAYLDGELEHARRVEMQEHLSSCAKCEGRRRSLGEVSVFLAPLRTARPAADLWSQIEARTDRGSKVRNLGLPWPPALLRAAAASVGIGLYLGLAWLSTSVADGPVTREATHATASFEQLVDSSSYLSIRNNTQASRSLSGLPEWRLLESLPGPGKKQ